MQKTKIEKINHRLKSLPDTYSPQILDYIGYLLFRNNIESECLYPDEAIAVEKFKKKPRTIKWDQIRDKL